MRLFHLAVLSCWAWAGTHAAEPAPPQELEPLLEEARAKNPAILAMRKKWELTEALIVPARTWKDPVFGVHREEMPGESEASTHYSIEQEVPFPGKLAAEGRMKYHEAQQAYQDYRAAELEVLSSVKVHYHRLAWLTQTAAALRKDADVLRAVARAASAIVASGKAGAEDALLAQAKLMDVENAVLERETQGLIEEGELNALLSSPPGTRRGELRPWGVRELTYSAKQLESLARETSPAYLGSVHEVHHAHLMTRRGRLGFAPDFTLTYEAEKFRRKKTETLYGASLSIPLWFWKPLGELKSAQAHTAHALADSADRLNMVFKEIYQEHAEVILHRRLALSLNEEILPLAEGALQITLKNYETGRGDFAKLSEALRGFLEVQMKYYEAVYHHGEHWAMLESLVGRELAAGGTQQ